MILDSSVLLQLMLDQPLSKKCKDQIVWDECYIPTLCIFEVYRKLRTQISEEDALAAISSLQAVKKVDLTESIALTAADLAHEYKLAMADAIVLAHARTRRIPLLTLDNDFSGIPSAIVIR